ncbi:MAG: HIT family protein [Firmicutes bacterium]|uniref:HIT family protein n=1 Tax=Candidatus Scybalomonas excrementavium TaxID=2840943 RepID=A0A9D9N8L8_9FIRM|nr:HIT family protein [Candidatus Scybalomonas excrementavium]
MKEDCIFCKIANGMIPSATIYENSDFKVILDVSPASKGHTLILPKEHFDNIFDMDADTAGKLFSLAAAVARALKQATNCDGMNIVQNNGEVAGQTVFHFHMHVIPRYEGDRVNVTWEPGQATAEQLNELAAIVKREL